MPNDHLRDRILKFQATEEEVVAWYLRGVLEKTGGNQSEAQRVLDIDRSTVRRRMERLGLVPPSPSSRSDLHDEDESSHDLRDRERDERSDEHDRRDSGDPRARGPR